MDPLLPPPLFPKPNKREKSRAQTPAAIGTDISRLSAQLLPDDCRFVDKSITKPKQVAVWATAASSSSGTHPPGHPPARSTSSCVRAQILFSNKLWVFPHPKKYQQPSASHFSGFFRACHPDPHMESHFCSGDDDNLQVAAQTTKWASGPSSSISQQSCSYFWADLFDYIRTSQPEQAPHSFILSSKIMHPSLPAIFFSCKF